MSDHTCSICLEPLLAPTCSNINVGTAVNCGHCFHTHCFSQWKSSKRGKTKCPNCNCDCKNFIKLFISSCDVGQVCKNDETSIAKTASTSSASRASTKASSRKQSRRRSNAAPGGSKSTNAPSSNNTRRKRSSRATSTKSDAPSPGPSTLRHHQISDETRLTRSSAASATTPTTPHQASAPVIVAPTRRVTPLPQTSGLSSIVLPSLRRRQTKAIKELRLSQLNLAKILHDRREATSSINALQEDQKTKRIRKLKASQQDVSSQICEHQAAMQSFETGNRRIKDMEAAGDLKEGLKTLLAIHREQREIVHNLYTEKISQVQNKASKLKEAERELKDTLLNLGAALKSLQTGRQRSKAQKKLFRDHQVLCTTVHGIGVSINVLGIDSLEKEKMKKMNQVDRDIQCLSKRVHYHGECIQSLCSF